MVNIYKSKGILIVVLCATLGYFLSFSAINGNIIQYSEVQPFYTVHVLDHDSKAAGPSKYVDFQLPVRSLLKINQVKDAKTITAGPSEETPLLFHQLPIFLIWFMLICIMISIAAGSFPVFTSQIIELKRMFNLSPKQIGGGIVYAFLLTLFLIASNGGHTLNGYYQPDKIINDFDILLQDGNMLNHIVLATILLLLPGFTLVFLIALSSDNIISTKTNDLTSIKYAVKKIIYLSKALEGVLQIFAIIVVFSVLTSSALGQSIRETIKVEGYEIFPKETSLVYGAYFSLFLCIIYVPVYYYIKLNYDQLKELAATVEEKSAEKGTYQQIFGEVQFKNTPLENIKLAFTVLAPLITSFLPQVLK
jgi:hypothetical protein